VNGETYYYTVTASDVGGNESPGSAEASATPQADEPPAAPTGLTATPGFGSVSLDWADNAEPDLASYNVYRSTTEGGL
jgi:fibronectin type 3 domain-containing protein